MGQYELAERSIESINRIRACHTETYLRTAVKVALKPPSQGPRNVDVKEDVEFLTKAPSPLVPHFRPSTKDLAMTSAKYGAVWV